VNRCSDEDVLGWLEAGDPGGHVTGYDIGGWEGAVWVLHPMFETDGLPEISWDDLAKRRMTSEPLLADVASYLDGPFADRGPDLRRAFPGLGWRRLRWDVLAERLGTDPPSDSWLPSLDVFPIRSWPIRISGPEEGCLDPDEFARLIEHLAAFTTEGMRGACLIVHAGLWTGDLEQPAVWESTLRELRDLYVGDQIPSPSNIWPLDRSWFVWTDYDLCGTKVSGSSDLVAQVVSDPGLESMLLVG
jgi:hypothetical protein